MWFTLCPTVALLPRSVARGFLSWWLVATNLTTAEPDLVPDSIARGATLDPATASVVVAVGPGAGMAPTIREGLDRALPQLEAGTPVRIQLAAGTWREVVDQPTWSDKAATTLLVIEAAPGSEVEWSGADRIAAAAWRDEGDGIWSIPWTHDFGTFSYSWATPLPLGGRRELVRIDGRPLMPVLLERQKTEGTWDAWSGKPIPFAFAGFTKPVDGLRPGQFAVAERPENGERLWVRLAPGEHPGDRVEVSVREHLLHLGGKSHVALRGIRFTGCANGQRDYLSHGPVMGLGDDLLVEDCRFRWNSGGGFATSGRGVTLRRVEASCNGFSGLGAGGGDVRWESVVMNANGWRGLLGGMPGWFIGGAKSHEVDGHVVQGCIAVGNLVPGIWWDIHVRNVRVENAFLLWNAINYQMELSEGPFHLVRVLAAGGIADEPEKPGASGPNAIILNADRALVEDSIFWTDTAAGAYEVMWYERDDEHAKRKPLHGREHVLRHSVVAGGARIRDLIHESNIGSRSGASYATFRHVGIGNLFWHPTKHEVFALHGADWQATWMDLAAWQATGRERDATWADPGFRDPAAGDFTLRADSPLRARADRLPLWRVPEAMRAEVEMVHAWLGWDRQRYVKQGAGDRNAAKPAAVNLLPADVHLGLTLGGAAAGGVTRSEVVVANQPFSRALRFDVATGSERPWEAMATASGTPRAIRAGERWSMSVWARCTDVGGAKIAAVLQSAREPWGKVVYREWELDPLWRRYTASGVATEDLSADGISWGFILGFRRQGVELGPVELGLGDP